MRRRWLLALVGALSGCGADSADQQTRPPDAEPVVAEDCIVWLHGKGGRYEAAVLVDGVAELSPAGNGEGWGAREWRYDTSEERQEAVAILTSTVDAAGCARVVVDGFSNGGGMAISLWCGGDDFDGRLRGVVADDPVPDDASIGCTPPTDVPVALYWTGDLHDDAPPGSVCADIDWTCAGGRTRPIEAVADDLGVTVQRSIFTEHHWYRDAPEVRGWLDRAAVN